VTKLIVTFRNSANAPILRKFHRIQWQELYCAREALVADHTSCCTCIFIQLACEVEFLMAATVEMLPFVT
jgi:hypothetical protein